MFRAPICQGSSDSRRHPDQGEVARHRLKSLFVGGRRHRVVDERVPISRWRFCGRLSRRSRAFGRRADGLLAKSCSTSHGIRIRPTIRSTPRHQDRLKFNSHCRLGVMASLPSAEIVVPSYLPDICPGLLMPEYPKDPAPPSRKRSAFTVFPSIETRISTVSSMGSFEGLRHTPEPPLSRISKGREKPSDRPIPIVGPHL